MTVPRVAAIATRRAEGTHRDEFAGCFGGVTRSIVIEVTLDDGSHGHGEATLIPSWSGEDCGAALQLVDAIVRPTIVGLAADAAGDALRGALAANGYLVWAVESAIAAASAPPRRAPASIPIRGLIGRVSAEAAATTAAAQAARGLTRFKVKLSGSLDEDQARLEAVRAAAPAAALIGDANEAIDPSDLPRYLPVFRTFELTGVEQPCSRTWILEHGLPPADGWLWVADESIWTLDDALALCEGPWDAWTLHPGKARGEAAMDRIVALAQEHGIGTVLGSNGEFGPGAAHLHRVAASLPWTEASTRLGHDHACALLIDGWSSPHLDLQGGLLTGV